MDPFTIAMLVGTIASLGGQVGNSIAQSKYQKKVEAAQEEEQKRAERAAYKQAMQRILETEAVPYDKPIGAVKPPSNVWNTVAGVGGALSNLAAAQYARQKYPTTPSILQQTGAPNV